MTGRVTKMGRYLLGEAKRNGGVMPEYPPHSPRHADIDALVRDGFAQRTLMGTHLTQAGLTKIVPRAKPRMPHE